MHYQSTGLCRFFIGATMSEYDTGNPVPSASLPDAWDNMQSIDKFVNSSDETITTRTGEQLDTLHGVNVKAHSQLTQQQADFETSQEERDAVVEETRQNLIPLSRQYMTLAAAQADIANIPAGSATYYRSPDDSALAIEVINNAGTLEPTGRKMPSQGEIDALNALISNDPSLSPFVQWEGDGGLILAQLAKDYLKTAGFEVGASRLSMRSLTIDEVSDKTIIFQDENGFVLEKYTQNTFQNISGKFIPTNDNNYVMEDENGFKFFSPLSPVVSGGTSNSNADRMSFIASMDNDALGYSLAINNKLVTGIRLAP